MSLLFVLLGLAFAEEFTGILRESDSGVDHDEDFYVLEVPDYPFFYELTGEEGVLLQAVKTTIAQEGLLGAPVVVNGIGYEEDFMIIVENIEKDTTAAISEEVKVGGNTGTATALVVIVGGGGTKPKRLRGDVGDKVFGYGGDRLNLNIFEKCSYGKFKVVPFEGTVNGRRIRKGVISIDLDYDPKGQDHRKVVRDALSKIKSIYGKDNMDGVDHTMLYLPKGVLKRGNDGWLAYAHAPGWMGVYNGDWMVATTTIAHELGHNLNLHHANENGQEYGDQSGIMGFGEMNLDGPDSCFNGPNNWQVGWYNDRRSIYRSGDGTKLYRIVGISEYAKTDQDDVVVLKVGKHTYVSLNRATGINRRVREFPDRVLIHTWEGLGKMTWMVKTLSKTGESYQCTDGSDMTITLTSLDLSGSPGYAMITVTSTGERNTANWIPVEPQSANMKGCKISSDGKCVEVPTYGDREKCRIEAASDGELMFTRKFELPSGEWKYDKLYIGSTHVRTAGELPSEIKNGDMLAWSTDSSGNGEGWKLCMNPRGAGGEDKCAAVTCPAATECQANVFCFGGECKSTPKMVGASCNDGNSRTVDDKCDAQGVCAGVDKCAGVDCSARNACEGDGTCDINTGKCSRNVFAPRNTKCDDGASYTINDVCDGKGVCKGEIDPSQALWRKVKGSSGCAAGGKCIESAYGNNEDCEFESLMRGALAFEGNFDIEAPYDKLNVDNTNVVRKSSLPSVIQKNRKVKFTSDSSETRNPWKICMSEAPPPPPPTAMNAVQAAFNSLALAGSNAKIDCALSQVAQKHAEYMRDNNHFSTRPRGQPTLGKQVSAKGSSLMGTLISAGGDAGHGDRLWRDWKATITKHNFKGFGVGSAKGGPYGNYAVLLLNKKSDLGDASACTTAEVALGEMKFGGDVHLMEETTQTFSELSPSMFSSVQNILAAIGVLGLVYGGFIMCFKKGAYSPVTYQEEI